MSQSNRSSRRSDRGRGRRNRGGNNGNGGGNGNGGNSHGNGSGRGLPRGLPADETFSSLDDEDLIYDGSDDDGERMNVADLKKTSMTELTELAEGLNVENAAGMRKQDLMFAILKAQTEKQGKIFSEGVLETLPDGFGFLRAPEYNYLPGPDDIYVSPVPDPPLRSADRRHRVKGQVRPAQGRRALLRPDQGRGTSTSSTPRSARNKIFFDNLTPLYPRREAPAGGSVRRDVVSRIMDLDRRRWGRASAP